MSFEWARSRTLENCRRERERTQSIQGADAPRVDMTYPLDVTFWGEKAAPLAVISKLAGDPPRVDSAPHDNRPESNHLHDSKGNGAT